jgi:GAF domain-containing protein
MAKRKSAARKAPTAKARSGALKRSPLGSGKTQRTHLASLKRELAEAQAQQAATAEILQAINASRGNLAPVFEVILRKAHELCGAPCGSLQLYEGGRIVPVAIRGMTRAFTVFLRKGYVISEGMRDRLKAREPVQLLDLARLTGPSSREPSFRAAIDLGKLGTMLTVPLAKNGVNFGRIVAARKEVRAFTAKEIAVLQGFAAQAVIAIENARLFNETKEALERQTATADILKVIASSPSDVQPVFQAIAERSNRLVSGLSSAVYRLVDGQQHLIAFTRISPEADAALQASFPRPLTIVAGAERINNGEIFEISDTELEFAAQPSLLEMARKRGFRSLVLVPLLRDGAPIGFISVTRPEPGRFTTHHIDLLRTFADQAVIAIENTRLFNETQEALERQTATADVLKVIASSPTNVQPVFDAIAERSNRLIGGHSTAVYHFVGNTVELVSFTSVNPEADAALRALFPRPLAAFRQFELVSHGNISQMPDVNADDVEPDVQQLRWLVAASSLPCLHWYGVMADAHWKKRRAGRRPCTT